MNSKKQAISQFFDSVKSLKDLGIIRSDKFLGDIAENLCADLYGVTLAQSGRQPDYDGTLNSLKIQIKYHGSETRTNIDLGNADMYDEVIVVLGPKSLLRNNTYEGEFIFYRLKSHKVKTFNKTTRGTYSCGQSAFNYSPDKTYNL
jgi:hypothetical protein